MKKASLKLSDAAAKKILLKWPQLTNRLFIPPLDSGYWLRAAPKGSQGAKILPKLHAPGSGDAFTTHPDGLYLFFCKREYADVISIEICGSIQNLHDKRSRYASTGSAIMLTCRRSWLREDVSVQGGGLRPRWKVLGLEEEPSDRLQVPVRFLRVLYSLPNAAYSKWRKNHVPAGHEYYCAHSSLDSHNSPQMIEFLRSLSIHSHFYTT